MATMIPYFNFQGRCTDAMSFYKDIFGGNLEIQKAGDSPAKDQMPEEQHSQVMHSHLSGGGYELMGTDMAMRKAVEGNTVYLALICNSETELKNYFEKLSKNATIEQAPQKAFFGWFGSLEDQFGTHWMFQSPAE